MPMAPINFQPVTTNAYGAPLQGAQDEAYFDRLRQAFPQQAPAPAPMAPRMGTATPMHAPTPYYAVRNGQQVTPYAGGAPAPATSGSYYATYKEQNVVPYEGKPQGGLGGALGVKPDDEFDRRRQLEAAAGQAGNFAGQGEAGYGAMTGELARDRDFYRDMMSGKNSVATEQLRQGLAQQQAAQMSMAAGASPNNSAMAARSAMMNMGRNQAAMTGQAALAQLAERQMAAQQLAQLNLGQRGQDINVGLGSRQNQMTGLGANKADPAKGPSNTDKFLAAAGAGLAAFSDERLKEDIADGDDAANRAMKALAAKTYKYKNQAHGKGEQLGIMAQDLEKVVPDAIIETSVGKAVHPGKLAGATAAMAAALDRRLSKLEAKGK